MKQLKNMLFVSKMAKEIKFFSCAKNDLFFNFYSNSLQSVIKFFSIRYCFSDWTDSAKRKVLCLKWMKGLIKRILKIIRGFLPNENSFLISCDLG